MYFFCGNPDATLKLDTTVGETAGVYISRSNETNQRKNAALAGFLWIRSPARDYLAAPIHSVFADVSERNANRRRHRVVVLVEMRGRDLEASRLQPFRFAV